MSTPESAAAPMFTKKKRLTKPALKFVVEKSVYVLIMSKIHEGAQRGKPQLDSDGKPKKPPMVCDVIDMTTGEDCTLICAEIIKTELAESYPNEGYIGRGFEISKQKRKEGKRYDPYDISEVELPEKFLPLAKKAIEDAKPAEAKAPADKPAETPAPASPPASDPAGGTHRKRA